MPQEWQIWMINQFTRVFSVLLRIGLVIVLAYAAQRLGRGLIARAVRVLQERKPEVPDYPQRLHTFEQILARTLMIAVFLIAGLMVLRELGFNIGPLLAGAGIVGLALSIGAQALVRDFLTGLVMLIEDQFHLGDQVNINGHVGRVERITPRTVWLRDAAGAVHIIPYSSIQIVENRTKPSDRVYIEVPVDPQIERERMLQDVEKALETMRRESAWSDKILASPQVVGVPQSEGAERVVRVVIPVRPDDHRLVHEEALRRVREVLDHKQGVKAAPTRRRKKKK